MVSDNRYQFLEGGGVCAQTRWTPIATKGDIFFPRRKLSTIATFSIPRSHFHVPPNPNVHPTFTFLKDKAVQCNNTHDGLQKQIGECQTPGHFQYFPKKSRI